MNITNHFRMPALATIYFSLFLVGCGGSNSDGTTTTSSAASNISSSLLNSSNSSNSSIASSTIASLASSSSSKSSSSFSVANSAVATFTHVNISAPSLTENLIHQPVQRDLWVYLPKAYFTSNTPLPVIYYLPGFGDTTMLGVSIPTDFNTPFNTLHPAILVVVEGTNSFGGSFFVDSAVTGKWSDFLLKDVVDYVDTHYRTIPHSRSRGIAGHSMGGFGALDLAMRHPEVFGSVFAISPGLVSDLGVADTQMFDITNHIKSFIATIAPIVSIAPEAALTTLHQKADNFDIAYGMAFAPLPNPPYFEYPYTLVNNALVRDDAIWAKWEAGFGSVHNEVLEFGENLSALNGIGIDCGINDEYQWIKRGCAYFDSELTAAEIEHTYTTHNGMHQDQLRKRVLDFMLPFFSQHLAVE